ncbi:uncharacterized protein LOC132299046 [Cornus florida]|uniref:uncharacterized protein LOC132299046 n=1 Tax=Cornus florida TaxID=4283 RepID=UPI00289F99A7|nr:uncharacterized protein LOC132299046 [Cornus florida]XP_059651463.1 uncharacterized protein LOC132299046 [Cornus florida]
MESKKSSGPDPDFFSSATAAAAGISDEDLSKYKSVVLGFFNNVGVTKHVPERYDSKHFYSNLIGGLLKVHRIERGRISCLLSVKPPVANFYGGLHGAAVAAVAEMVSIACARTVVGKDKNLFLGELSISYLSAAPENAELIVDGSVVRRGRNLTVTAIEFRLKGSEKLTYTSRATFYNMPVASL